MTAMTYDRELEAVVLTAEACLEKHDFKNLLYDFIDSLNRRLESLQTDQGFGFLKFQDEE